jgi:DNA-binding NarL/FixJ family response regulator
MDVKKKLPAPPKAKVLLVDDHPLVRERLGELIGQQHDMTVCGDCAEATACFDLVAKTEPDLVVLDLSLKGVHGMEIIKNLAALRPKLPVLVLSMHDESLFAERALRAGARGYITKQEATEKVLVAIRRVLSGEVYVSEKMAAQLVGVFIHGRKKTAGSPMERLTDRELEVFQLLGSGLSTRQIADDMKLDIKTVETYRARLKEKLNLETANELLQHAIRWAQTEQPS